MLRPLIFFCFIFAVFPETMGSLETSSWKGRSLKSYFGALASCPQGPQETVTRETMLNPPNYWETTWGRTDSAWPRRGMGECWANRGSVCALPDTDHVVCLPPSRRGSTIAKGWALDPKSQACKPGVHCLYACEPGYYWTAYNQGETSNFDQENAQMQGNCDGTWNYGTSSQGVFCKQDGTLDLPNKPLCKLGETYVYAENRLDTHIFLCQTVFPGHEIFLIPTLVRPGESVMITTQPSDFWHGPSYSKPTHGDFYVSFAGADIMEACTWDEFSPSGASLLPYEIGSGVEDNGVVYSTHYFYQQPNSEVPRDYVGYVMDLECESSEKDVCGPIFKSNNVVKADVLKKPRRQGSTKVKFIFKTPDKKTDYGEMYREPNQNYLQDVSWITGMKQYSYSHSSSHSSSYASHSSYQSGYSTYGGSYQSSAQDDSYQSSAQDSTYVSGQGETVPGSAYSSSHATSAGGGSATSTSAATTGGSSDHQQGQQTQQSTGFYPDFTSGDGGQGSGSYASASSTAYSGRRLKGAKETSNVFLHNTLKHPIVICDGNVKQSGGRGMSVGPGEKVQLEARSEIKIMTQIKNSGRCEDAATYHWHISNGHDNGEHIIYSYTQADTHKGYRLALNCVSEEAECVSPNGRTVILPSTEAGTHEMTYVVKPAPNDPSQETYAWGSAVHGFMKGFFGSLT